MPSRTPRDLARALKRGEFERAYYLYGPEDVRKEEALRYLVDRAVDPATRDFNYDLRSAGQLDPESVEALCNTMPMMAERRLVVIRDVEQWKRKTKARSAFVAYLEKPAPDTIVVLVQGSAEPAEDKELARLATPVSFEVPSADEARDWLEKRAAEQGITFQPGAMEHLLKCTESSLAALRLELEKLSSLGGAEPIDRKSTRLNSSHVKISYAVFCLKKKRNKDIAVVFQILNDKSMDEVRKGAEGGYVECKIQEGYTGEPGERAGKDIKRLTEIH